MEKIKIEEAGKTEKKKTPDMEVTAIILAAGEGKRMKKLAPATQGNEMDFHSNKVFITINGKSILEHTLDNFQQHPLIDNIILVTHRDDVEKTKEIVVDYLKVSKIVTGGKLRQNSSYNGIMEIAESPNKQQIVLIHDGARPFVTTKIITNSILDARENCAAITAITAIDTIKLVNPNSNLVSQTLERKKCYQVQTPQSFKLKLIKDAHVAARKDNFIGTDDSSLVEKMNHKVWITKGSPNNFKITTPDDLAVARVLCSTIADFKVGVGLDSHRFLQGVESRKKSLILGGVTIPDIPGMDANSDGDVILHSLFNALSSSIGWGSISLYADDLCKKQGITDSKEYIKIVKSGLDDLGYKVNNISITVEAKRPKLEPHIEQIKNSVSTMFEIPISSVGITVTSGEGLSDFGKGLGIQALTKVSIIKMSNKHP